jgi:hypothetical protein
MQSNRRSTNLYFTNVLALPGIQAVVAGHLVSEKDEPTATIVLHIAGGKWSLVGKIPDVVYSIALDSSNRHSEPGFGVLGREGYFAVFKAGVAELRDAIVRGHPAYLEGLVCTEGIFFACGAQRQVVCRSGNGWSRVDQELYVPFDGSPTGFLLGIAARSPNDLFVCGSEGFAASWNGRRWSRIEIPTNMDLNSVFCSSNGDTYFAGAGGSLFALRSGGRIDHLSDSMVSKNSFFDICEFNQDLYVAAGDQLVRLSDGHLELVLVPRSPNGDVAWIYSVSAAESLWCVGDEYVREFDGSRWLIHECPANR